MDKTAIKNFSIWARNKLIADITYKAGLLGITEEGIKDALPQSTQDAEFYDIGTKEPYAIHGEEMKQRKELVSVIQKSIPVGIQRCIPERDRRSGIYMVQSTDRNTLYGSQRLYASTYPRTFI